MKNGLQHLAMNQGMQKKRKLWSEAGQKLLRELPLEGWAACRREDLLELLTMLDEQIGQLDEAVQASGRARHPQAQLLMTQPGVGPITALAFVLTIGDVSRFRARQAGGQLSGTDSARAQLGRTAAAGRDQQAGQPVSAQAAGGSGAECGALRSKVSQDSISIAAITSRKAWPRWRRHASWRYDSTGCCAPTRRIRRSFASRAARGCPWSAQARPMN